MNHKKEFDQIIETRGQRFLLFVETSSRDEDYQKYEDLRQQIWEEPADHFSGRRNMAGENYFAYGSSLFTGTYAGEANGKIERTPKNFIGFTYGYVSPKDKNSGFRKRENLRFYSQYAAVREDMRQFGLGTALKYHQADAVQNILGVDVMCCTFDPLTGVNANRNIRKLGMRVEKYIVSCYQDFGGRLNRKDVPSDRFFASWDLTKKAAPPQRNLEKSAHDIPWALRSRIIRIQGRSGMNDAQAPEEYDVLSGNQKPDYVLAEIPENFYRLIQETDVAEAAVRRIPRDWRMASRRVFSSLMESGYRIQDFQRITLGGRFRNLYILQKGN